MLIALFALLLHLPVIVVLHPGIVYDSRPGRHSDGYLLLLTTELRYSGAAVDAGAGCVIEGSDPYETRILARGLKVLEVVGIDDCVNSRDGANPHHA